MKIVVAADKFKGSLSASAACEAIARGVRRALPRAKIVQMPLADGGEGTVEALVSATGGRLVRRRVTGPLGDKVRAPFGLLGDGKTAVIEMAAASGLALVPERKRNPMITTTRDGGAGMAQALGARLLDARGREIGPGGGGLAELTRIDVAEVSRQRSAIQVLVACDVTNPLCGPKGASAVYGPQKGATPGMVKVLDRNLRRYARIVERDILDSPSKLHDRPGAGAAGGLGFGLRAFLDARLERGIELVLDLLDFDSAVRDADLIVTGEGAIDEQTVHGKVPSGVAQRARRFGVPVIAIGGTVPPDANALFRHGVGGLLSICHSPMSLREAMDNAASLLETAAERAVRLFCSARP
jgi:glycerate kinase